MDFTKPHGIGAGLQTYSPKRSIHQGVADLVRTIVPRAKQLPDFKSGDDFEKALRVNIREACKTLTTRLRNIVEKGDAGGFVLLRRQLHEFREAYSHQLESLNPADVRPLDILQESIDACDTKSLLENGAQLLIKAIGETRYMAVSVYSPNNDWGALEGAMMDTVQLAQEIGKTDLIKLIIDAYYSKHLDGVISDLEKWESQTFDFEEYVLRSSHGHESHEPTVFGKMRDKLSGKVSDEFLVEFEQRINNYTISSPIRKGRLVYENCYSEIDWVKNDLKALQSNKRDNGFLEFVFTNVLQVLDNIRPGVLEMAAARQFIYNPDDLEFISQMEEVLMSLYRDFFVYMRPFMKEDYLYAILRKRLVDMGKDIQSCSGNKVRFPIWSVWFKDLTLGQRQQHNSSRKN